MIRAAFVTVALGLAPAALFAAEPVGRNGAIVTTLVAPPPGGAVIHGMNGVGWGVADGMLYVISDLAGTIYKVDPKTRAVSVEVPFPDGGGDDVAQGPDGALAWTATAEGELRYRRPGGKVQVLAHDVPNINPVAFRSDGRLVAGQVNVPGTPFFEVDPTGKRPKRIISTDMDELNSFGFGPDGLLYAPAIRVGKAVAIDIDTGQRTVLAEGFGRLASVKLDGAGRLIALESRVGHVSRVDPKTGQITRLITLPPLVDNTASGGDNTIYVSSPPDSIVHAVDPVTGAASAFIPGQFTAVGGLVLTTDKGLPVLMAADDNSYRAIDLATGKVTRRPYVNDPAVAGGGSNDLAIQGGMVAVSRARGGVVQLIDHAAQKVIFESKDIKTPYGIAFVGDAAMVVADYAVGRIVRVDASGTTTLASGLKGPVGLVMDGPGHVLMTEHTAGAIRRVDLATGTSVRVARGLKKPEGLAVLADGRIAVAEAGASRVSIIDRKSGRKTVVAEKLDFSGRFTRMPDEVGFAAGLAIGPDGALYVSCDGDNSVRKIALAK